MPQSLDRRRFLTWFSTTGFGVFLSPRVLAQETETISIAAIAKAEELAGFEFTVEERELMKKGVEEHLENFKKLREIPLPNQVPPALTFSPLLPGRRIEERRESARFSRIEVGSLPTGPDALPFLSVLELAALIRTRRIRSVELTRLYLSRLKSLDSRLRCVITLMEEPALEQAERADRDILRGMYRGPLHGVPWGAKDLLATPDFRTTWGAMPFQDQVIPETATVVKRLEEAGAVLIAKLSVGALAWGDVWFGGTTRNPWNLEQGSNGSSAGPAAATVAGCAGFTIGTETLGSIISPSQRCGATGLRPTFGRVSRHGCMALSWSMDKIGPICRSVEDCAAVLDAIRGIDGRDASVLDAPFPWDPRRSPQRVRLGYDPESFDEESDDHAFDEAALETLRGMGFDLVPVRLPGLPVGDLGFILEAEAAAAFDELTRSGQDDLLVRQIEQAWPNVFRTSRLIPAVEYIQANRARTILMEKFEETMEEVDVYVHSTYGGKSLLAANLTGHPSIVLPNGFREDGTPTSISFTGRLFGEADLLLVAKAYQDETGYHRQHPML